jgi:organic hydroperoxide reductase OsmC/OhrA
MTTPTHRYATRIIWDGNRGDGTAAYAAYGRDYRILLDGKPELSGSADPAFRGDRNKHNPEELFVAALSACHMLFYLSLCARAGIIVVAYEDAASATLVVDPDGGGRLDEVVLHPAVTVACADDIPRALELHARAHALCFLASSCATPIHHTATVRAAGARS